MRRAPRAKGPSADPPRGASGAAPGRQAPAWTLRAPAAARGGPGPAWQRPGARPATSTLGWYGKLPSIGDFASRRLPPDFVEAWDGWLQRSLAALHADWGSGFGERFAASPACRWWAAPGLLGARGWCGVLLPSADSVGRAFPLTIASPLEASGAALDAPVWFDAVEDIARQARDRRDAPEALEQALASLAVEAPLDGAAGAGEGSAWWRAGTAPCVVADGLPPPARFAALVLGAP